MTVTLNRPEAKNAANKALAEGVSAAMDELDSNDDVRVAILTGAGGTFCSGMDLKAFVSGETPSIEGRGFAGLTEYTPSKPLIAAVEGYALAGGLELAISCDLIVTADNAKFGIPEVKRGLAAAAGGLMKLPRQIPPRLAMELALTGDFISAQRASEVGWSTRLSLLEPRLKQPRHWRPESSPMAHWQWRSASKWCWNPPTGQPAKCGTSRQDLVMPVFSSEDAIEGSVAFAEKRAPNWKGK